MRNILLKVEYDTDLDVVVYTPEKWKNNVYGVISLTGFGVATIYIIVILSKVIDLLAFPQTP